MALPDELEALTKAFSGHGVEENSLISILGKSHPEHRRGFRKNRSQFFLQDERQFERWNDVYVELLEQEFLRFKDAVVLWIMHPWERDARLIKEALVEGRHQYGVIVEVACTRSAEELLGARRAYHSLFDHSVEEDVATHMHGSLRKLLVALVSAYRYEGQTVKQDEEKSDATKLSHAIKSANKHKPIEDEEVVRILTTRSKLHLKEVFQHYNHICGKSIIEDLAGDNFLLEETVECLYTPHTYFAKVLDSALKIDADKNAKKAVTRVIVSRADTDIKEINEKYHKQFGVSLEKKIKDTAKGNYRDFLLSLLAKGN
ncbi:hypothetical protein SLE2022_065770 [Rubroshorea leprosula]